MAKRRDGMTRAIRQYERATGERVPTSYSGNGNNKREAIMRNKGHRGVRARARLTRQVEAHTRGSWREQQRADDARQQAVYRRAIAEGRGGGLTRQPDGGYTTNS